MQHVRGCAPYAASYRTSIERLTERDRNKLFAFAAQLRDGPYREDLYFFRDMLGPPFDTRRIRVVFAMLRMALVMQADDERAALYSPVATERSDPGFELHADLFLTTRVWLIFDDVPDDGRGASLFLSRREVLRSIRSIPAIPEEQARSIAQLMTKPIARDSFGKLFTFLHSKRNPWYWPLRGALQRRQSSIALHRGEGYLIDDRRWLHGRTAVMGRVSSSRFHRLTYSLAS